MMAGEKAAYMSGGRPQTITNAEIIEVLQTILDWPTIAAVDTKTISEEFDVSRATVRNRLKSAREDDTVPITGFQPGERTGYVWWLTDTELY